MDLKHELTDDYKSFVKKYNIVLNEQQEHAVQRVNGANLLLAVPGSGKTTVLVARLGFMIMCKNISPKNILAMTYTKAATKDMRLRFASIFGDELAKQLAFRTINGIADITIKRYAQKTKKPAFELLSDEKQKTAIIRGILQKLKQDYPTESEIIEAETSITYIKNMMLSEENIEELKLSIPDVIEVYHQYKEILKNKRLMDYDDQLVYALAILKKNHDILNAFQQQYQYICVDEAQDTSKLQHEIIRLLAQKNSNIFMVGDEDQSIYGFRAAYPKALTDFENDYPNSSVLYIERNYRSTFEIISTAAKFIEKNSGRYNKKIIPVRDNGESVKRIEVRNRAEQYRYLLNIAKNANKETAILYRDNDSAIPLMDLMLRNSIPFNKMKFKGLFFTNKVVADVTAFLKLAINPNDTESFMKIYYKCGLGFKKETAEWTCNRAKREGIPIYDALIKQLEKWDRLRNKAVDFKEFIISIASKSTEQALYTIYGRYSIYMRKNNLDFGKFELLSILATSETSIRGFLSRLDELQSILSKEEVSQNGGVILSTVHSAKGLEYDSVYIMDVYDSLFPNVNLSEIKNSAEAMEKYQEERRLFYVAMTRAKNNLYVIAIENKNTSFLDEILPIEKPESKSVNSINIIPEKSSEEIERENRFREKEFERVMKQRKIAEEKAKAERQVAQEASIRRGYEEVKNRFTQQSYQIIDSKGRRWIKCEICGKIKLSREFVSYGGANYINLGICYECSQKK